MSISPSALDAEPTMKAYIRTPTSVPMTVKIASLIRLGCGVFPVPVEISKMIALNVPLPKCYPYGPK